MHNSRQKTLLLTLAALAPLAVWVALTSSWPLVDAPFGWWHVTLVTSLLVWPVCYFGGYRIADNLALGDESRQTYQSIAVGLAVAVAVASLWAVNPVGQWLEEADAGFTARAILRVVWCLAIELPWHVGAWLAVPAAARTQRLPAGLVWLSIVAAAVLPSAYARDYAAKQTEVLRGDLARNQLMSADSLSIALSALGSPWTIDDQPVRVWRDRTAARLANMFERVQAPLAADASTEQRLTRARELAMLELWPQAREVVGPLARQSVDAALLVAVTWQDQRDFAESDRYYQRAMNLVGDEPDANGLAQLRRAIDGIAYNAREDRRPKEAEAVYRKAIADLPQSEAAYFHFQLGRHYELGGRPHDALGELQTAVRLDPAQFAGPANELINSIRVSSPACVLAAPVVLEESRVPSAAE